MNAYQILFSFIGVFNFSEKLAPRQQNRSTTLAPRHHHDPTFSENYAVASIEKTTINQKAKQNEIVSLFYES